MTAESSRNVFVEFHVLVSHAPSNLNRDDLGAPKTAVFGGVRRLRISSQCLKRSWRKAELFARELGDERATRLGVRTARIGDVVLGKVGDPPLEEEQRAGLDAFLASLGKKDSATAAKKDDEEGGAASDDDDGEETSTKTAHLLYLSGDEHDAVVAFVKAERDALGKIGALLRSADEEDAKAKADAKKSAPSTGDVESTPPKKPARGAKGKAATESTARKDASASIKEARKRLDKHLAASVPRSAVDIALFGRFLTESEFREIDAAMQVAHAIGTQKADMEYDYFTAMDDRTEEAAAGHIGESELGASVFYKYAVCDTSLLHANLGASDEEAKDASKNKDAAALAKVQAHRANARDVAARALKAIAHAMARVVPTGKKNSTAAENPADYVEVVIRRDAPVSLANAFLDPVRADRDGDVMGKSIDQLRRHANKYDEMYSNDDSIVARFVLSSRTLPKDAPLPRERAEKVTSLSDLGTKITVKLLEVMPA